MRISFICNEYPPAKHGGIGTMTQTIARGLVEAGHSVRVVGLSAWEDNLPASESDEGVLVWRLKFRPSRFGWIRARHELFRVIERWATCDLIDLVEVPDYQGFAAAWPRLAVPVVIRMNGSVAYFAAETGGKLNRRRLLIERTSLRRADFLCSSSRYTALQTARLFGLNADRITVLYNPVTTSSHLQAKRSRKDVLFSGTLTYKKGIVSLIQAWPLVKQACPEAALHIFGKDGRTSEGGSMRDFLTSSLPAELRDSVEFYGHVTVEELRVALETARVAVFPSYSEAFAIAPMEAMAEGCPTIYSSLASGPELIQHGRNGLLVDPADPNQIARHIISVLQDDRLAADLGEAGRNRVEREFSLPVLLARNVEFYANCIRSFAASHSASSLPALTSTE